MRTAGRWIVVTFAALLIAGLASCSKDNEPGGMKQLQTELRSQLDSTIADVDREMSRVKSNLQAADDKTRQELNAEMDRMEAARDDLHQSADKVAETTADNWNELVMPVDRSLEKARQTLKEIRDQAAQKQQQTPAG